LKPQDYAAEKHQFFETDQQWQSGKYETPL
jgi:hypothetical protein